ncbi:antibiotic biosynthesis monooxygenase family protein [Lacrimispora sp. JR3]|uniref:antibiotic biosynthesis monooxygenase family protein n=1 Tax=Lacrimispora sinapis TaxID=3111456 RepID=UPI003748222D
MSKIFDLPYYAVIFKSKRSPGDNGYSETAQTMVTEAAKQDGFLGADSVRDEDGIGITVSYWASLESIEKWKMNALHMHAKSLGKQKWYEEYTIRICKVEYDNSFPF